MKVAFYAPLKPPHHPVPSGDRAMARGLIAALEAAGLAPELASTLQTREAQGVDAKQTDLIKAAADEIPAIVSQGRTRGWKAWITYHNYYKAPDLLGPSVASALGIPYLQIESTRASKRLNGPWARYAAAAEAASDAASVIFYFTQRDAEALRRDAPAHQHLVHLAPFLAQTDLPVASDLQGAMLSVGMMRSGDKVKSYTLIAETLALPGLPDWRLDIAGDGPARAEVSELMAPFGARVRLLGALDKEGMAQTYAHARLMFWPGVNEAFGMTYLEAQAYGVPVVAQDRPGVRDVLAPGRYPSPEECPHALARKLMDVLKDPLTPGRIARAHVEAHHLMQSASATLKAGLARAGVL